MTEGMINRLCPEQEVRVFPDFHTMMSDLGHEDAAFLMMLLQMGMENAVVRLNLLLLESTTKHSYDDIIGMLDRLQTVMMTNGALVGEPALEVMFVCRIVAWKERPHDGVVEEVTLSVPEMRFHV